MSVPREDERRSQADHGPNRCPAGAEQPRQHEHSTEMTSVTISAHCTALSVNERLRFDICAMASPSASEYGTFSSA